MSSLSNPGTLFPQLLQINGSVASALGRSGYWSRRILICIAMPDPARVLVKRRRASGGGLTRVKISPHEARPLKLLIHRRRVPPLRVPRSRINSCSRLVSCFPRGTFSRAIRSFITHWLSPCWRTNR
jgi:hypothetical protein